MRIVFYSHFSISNKYFNISISLTVNTVILGTQLLMLSRENNFNGEDFDTNEFNRFDTYVR